MHTMGNTNESAPKTVEVPDETDAEQVSWLNVSERACAEIGQHFNADDMSRKVPAILFSGYG